MGYKTRKGYQTEVFCAEWANGLRCMTGVNNTRAATRLQGAYNHTWSGLSRNSHIWQRTGFTDGLLRLGHFLTKKITQVFSLVNINSRLYVSNRTVAERSLRDGTRNRPPHLHSTVPHKTTLPWPPPPITTWRCACVMDGVRVRCFMKPARLGRGEF